MKNGRDIFTTDEHGLTCLRQGYGKQARIPAGNEEVPIAFFVPKADPLLAENKFPLSVFIRVHPW